MGGTNNGYTGLVDMIDGGGAQATGQTFQGGGILSDIANTIAKPRGYYDRLNNPGAPMQAPMRQFAPAPIAPPMRPEPRPMQHAAPVLDVAPPVSPRQVPETFSEFYLRLDPQFRAFPPEVLRKAYEQYINQGAV